MRYSCPQCLKPNTNESIWVNGYLYCKDCGAKKKAVWDKCPHKKSEWFNLVDDEWCCTACQKEELVKLRKELARARGELPICGLCGEEREDVELSHCRKCRE